jgi:hypothetical protein
MTTAAEEVRIQAIWRQSIPLEFRYDERRWQSFAVLRALSCEQPGSRYRPRKPSLERRKCCVCPRSFVPLTGRHICCSPECAAVRARLRDKSYGNG